MTSLTQTSVITRKIIKYSILAIVLLIVGKVLFGAGAKVYRHFFPAPPPPPTVAFGKLPKLEFPQNSVTGNLTYKVETAQGGLPLLPTQAKVYFMPKLSPNLLSLDGAIQKAEELGFLPQPQEISQTIYRFPHKDAPSSLQINIVTGIFSVSYDLSKDSSPLERIPPAPEVAASQVRSYLSSADLLPEALTGPTSHEYLKIEDGKLVTALGQSEASLIKVNFFRKSYDDLSSLPPTTKESNIWFLVSGAREKQKQIVAAEFHYFPVDESELATYPIKNSDEAYQELLSGGGYIASSPMNEGIITIRKVFLAYYDAGKQTDFFQPIIVFEGDGFRAFVPAVRTEYYGE